MSHLLTIAIPTYNRPLDLSRTVGLLIEQLDVQTQLLVLDNCSNEPAETVLEPFLRKSPERLRIVRNSLNVGVTANIMRCIEFAESPYVWVMSDDDLPTPDSVSIVHRYIHETPDCAFWKFSSAQYPFEVELRASSAEDFLNFVGTMWQAIWISNGVINRRAVAPHFAIASHWSSSSSAHMLLILLALEAGYQAIISTKTIAEHKPPVEEQKGDLATIYAGFPLLLDAPLQWRTKQILGRYTRDIFGRPEGLAIRVTETDDDVWCYAEKVYHYRALGSAIYRCFGNPIQRLKFAVIEQCLAVIGLAGKLDHRLTGGKIIVRPGLAVPTRRARM